MWINRSGGCTAAPVSEYRNLWEVRNDEATEGPRDKPAWQGAMLALEVSAVLVAERWVLVASEPHSAKLGAKHGGREISYLRAEVWRLKGTLSLHLGLENNSRALGMCPSSLCIR